MLGGVCEENPFEALPDFDISNHTEEDPAAQGMPSSMVDPLASPRFISESVEDRASSSPSPQAGSLSPKRSFKVVKKAKSYLGILQEVSGAF